MILEIENWIKYYVDDVRCKYGKHDWNYYDQEVNLSTKVPKGIPNVLKVYSVRTCKKCLKKQWGGFGLRVGNKPINISYNKGNNLSKITWLEFNIYTKEEKREKIIKELL